MSLFLAQPYHLGLDRLSLNNIADQRAAIGAISNTDLVNALAAYTPTASLAPVALSGSATHLTTGTLADERLSSNVPLKNAASNVFTGAATFGGQVTVNNDLIMTANTLLARQVRVSGAAGVQYSTTTPATGASGNSSFMHYTANLSDRLYLYDLISGRNQVTYIRGANDAAALAQFHSRMSVNDSLTVAGAITAASDVDSNHTFGRVRIGSAVSDLAYFSHFDHYNNNTYALRQDSAGLTVLNGSSSGVELRVSNAAALSIPNTSQAIFQGNVQIGSSTGVRLNNIAGNLEVRNGGNTAFSRITALELFLNNSTYLSFADNLGVHSNVGMARSATNELRIRNGNVVIGVSDTNVNITGASFQLESGVRVKNVSGALHVRDAADSAFADVRANSAVFGGTVQVSGASGTILLQPFGGATIVQGNLLTLDATSDTLWLRTEVGTSIKTPIILKGNAVWLSANQWHGDQVNSERLYFIGNSTTILKGYGTTTHLFRNETNGNLLRISSTGSLGVGSLQGLWLSDDGTTSYVADGTISSRRLSLYTNGGPWSQNLTVSAANAITGSSGQGITSVFTFSGSSGTQANTVVDSTYTQTGTASSRDLWVRRTQTTIGSGSHFLIEATVNGASRFSVNTVGNITAFGTLQLAGAGAMVKSFGGILQARSNGDAGFAPFMADAITPTTPDFGSISTPANSRLRLGFASGSYIAGTVTGRGYSTNLAYADVIISASPNASIVDHSNLTDDLAIRGNTGNVEINRGTLRLKTGAWHGSTEGLDRLFFVASGPTYFKGHGVGIIYEWRDANDALRMSMGAGGQLTLAGSRPIIFTPGSGIITIQASTGGWSNDLRFLGSGGTHLTGFGANGTNDTLNNAYIGIFGAEIARFAPGGLVSINMATQSGRSLSILPQNTSDRSGVRIYDYGGFGSSVTQSGVEVAYLGGTFASPTTTVAGHYRNILTFRTGGTSGSLFANPSFAVRCTIGAGIGTTLSEVNTSFLVTPVSTGIPINALTMFGQTGLVNIDQGTIQLGSDVRLKNSNGELLVRNTNDSNYAIIRASGIRVYSTLGIHDPVTGSEHWSIYKVAGNGNRFDRDIVNGRMHVTYTAGVDSVAALTQFHSRLTVEGLVTASAGLSIPGSALGIAWNGSTTDRLTLNTGPGGRFIIRLGGVDVVDIDRDSQLASSLKISAGNSTFAGHVTSAFQTLSADPSTIDIPSGSHRLVKNTTSGEIRDWVNDGGVMKKSQAYT